MSGWDVDIDDARGAAVEVDDRLGDHDVVVMAVEAGEWDDGRPRVNFSMEVLTANHAKLFLTLSRMCTQAEKDAAKAAGQNGKAWAMGQNNRLVLSLMDMYEKNPADVSEGDKFRVRIGKKADKRDPDKPKAYFLGVIEFLPSVAIGKDGAAGEADAF